MREGHRKHKQNGMADVWKLSTIYMSFDVAVNPKGDNASNGRSLRDKYVGARRLWVLCSSVDPS